MFHRCDRCPLCRGEIENIMHIFLPVEFQKSLGVIVKWPAYVGLDRWNRRQIEFAAFDEKNVLIDYI